MKIKNNSIRKTIKEKSFEEPKAIFAKSLLFLLLTTSLINFLIVCIARTFGYNMNSYLYNNLITLITIIISSPLYLNYVKMFLKNSHDDLVFFTYLFQIKKYSFKFLWYTFIISSICFLITYFLNLVPVFGLIINIVLSIIIVPALFFIPYIFLENTKISLIELIKESFKLVRKKRTIFYALFCSFTPWIILGIITLGILFFYIIPYMYIAFTYLYLYFKDEIKFPKKKILSNEGIILLFILGILIINVILFISRVGF